MARKRFSRAIEKAIYNKYNGLCGICARKFEFDDGEIDHITPLSKGGSNDTTNLQWSCPRCNKLKGNQLTNKQVRKLLSLPEDYDELLELSNKEKTIEELPKAKYLDELPVLSQEGLDASEIETCISNLQESFQRLTIIPEICNTIITSKKSSDNFVTIGLRYRVPRLWFLPYNQTQQAYSNEYLFNNWGRAIALGEQNYIEDKILKNKEITRVNVAFSPDDILDVIKEMRSVGFEPNIIATPINSWMKMHKWRKKAHIEYTTITPKPRLDSSLILDGFKLKVIPPLGDFPKETILMSNQLLGILKNTLTKVLSM